MMASGVSNIDSTALTANARYTKSHHKYLQRIRQAKLLISLGREETCRRGPNNIALETLFSYLEAGEADLIKGHIYTGVQSFITRIQKEDVQSKMSEDNA